MYSPVPSRYRRSEAILAGVGMIEGVVRRRVGDARWERSGQV